jgi:hypothetical protein
MAAVRVYSFAIAMNAPRILALVLAASICAPATEFWDVKDSSLWSGAQIRTIVTDSPWAKEASVSFKGNTTLSVKSRGGPAGRLGAEGSDPVSGEAARPNNGAGMGPEIFTDSRSTPPPIVVRWESAHPVCEACARGGMDRFLFSCTSKILYLSDLERKFEELSQEFYILSMSNYPSAGLARDAPQHSAAAAAILERMGERIQQSTFLTRKGKSPLEPSKAVILPTGRTLLVILFFSRTGALSPADKEVVFDSDGDTIRVKSRFNLGKMLYKQRLDL